MPAVGPWLLGLLAASATVACGAGDGVYDIQVQPCFSSRSAPVAFGIFYSVDDVPQPCFVQNCGVDSIAECLIGAVVPDVPSGSSLELQVVLYSAGPERVACSEPITRTVDSETTIELALQCSEPMVEQCPLPTSCEGLP